MPTIQPVILAGGSGTRLWPLSRSSFPKQFCRLAGETSLFQAAADRVDGPGFDAPLVVTREDFRFVVTEQLAAARKAARDILIEPEARNTAPAILAAALWCARETPDALLLVLPSDHVIPDAIEFRRAVEAATPRALAGDLVTFGVRPTRAETGYGYLELAGGKFPDGGPVDLAGFVEKPDATRAEEMMRSGRHLWNAGVFLFRADAVLAAFERHAPDLLDPVAEAVDGASRDLGFTRLAWEPWCAVEDISFDFAIMEHAPNRAVMPFLGDWSDLGDWQAVWEEAETDAFGVAREGDALAIDCRDTLLRSETPGVALVGIGLEDVVAVAMGDAVVVARKSRAQDVRAATARLAARGARQGTEFPRKHRPWGWFESLILGDRFQVKKIEVHPGEALSLQSHHHRSEHWIIVEGTALVTLDEVERLVTENESVYVPVGTRHRIENPGRMPLTLIEVQTGSYLGEDDIERYEDRYARPCRGDEAGSPAVAASSPPDARSAPADRAAPARAAAPAPPDRKEPVSG